MLLFAIYLFFSSLLYSYVQLTLRIPTIKLFVSLPPWNTPYESQRIVPRNKRATPTFCPP
jgi:hypothetical protein